MDASQRLGSSQRSLPNFSRKRQIRDLIQIASLFEKEGLLSTLELPYEDFIKKRANELSVIAAISESCARGILMIMGLRDNEGAWKVLSESGSLQIFDECFFFTGEAEPHQGKDELFRFTFLKRFVNDKNPYLQEKKLLRSRMLDSIALKFTAPARDICVEMFLRCAAVIGTLCSFFPKDLCFDHIKTLDVIDRYLSRSWNSPTRQFQYQNSACRQHASSGWHIVHVTFMIQVQELQFWKERDTGASREAAEKVIVSEEDVNGKIHVFCHKVVIEFFAWIFQSGNIRTRETAESFQARTSEIIEEMNSKLAQELGCENVEPLPRDLIASTLTTVESKAPTMADIDYDDIKMVPFRRQRCSTDVDWSVKDVLMRGRWKQTPALKTYSTYLSVASQCQHDQTVVQARPPNKETCLKEKYRTGLLSTGVKRPAINRADQISPNRKRTRRLNPATTNASESATDKSMHSSHSPGKSGSLYANDGDNSEGEIDNRKVLNHQKVQGTHDEAITDPAQQTSNAIEKLYESVLIWPIFPVLDGDRFESREGSYRNLNATPERRNSRNKFPARTAPLEGHRTNKSPCQTQSQNLTLRQKIALHLLTSMEPWAEGHCERYREHIMKDVTTATSVDAYRRHWKAIIPFEIRAMVTDCIQSLLPKCKADPTLQFPADIGASEFVSCLVHEVAPTRKLLNITCKTTNAVLSKRIAKEFQGGTLCVGYVKGEENGKCTFTNLSLFACRRVCWDEEDVLPVGTIDTVHEMEMHLVCCRNRFRNIGIWKGSTVYLLQLCHFAPFLRMYKAVEEIYALPRVLQDVLFGNHCPSSLIEAKPVEEHIDPGCAAYLQGLRANYEKVDDPQLKSLRSVLANVGDGNQLASSFSMIHGPPGTGKTTTILYLIGSLMHHSKIGHVGEEQTHILNKVAQHDDIVRCRKKSGGVRILVCAPSNKAVDNILKRIHFDGIPDGKGGVLRPQAVRLSRAGYDHGELRIYSLRNKSLPFDEHLHNVGQRRNNPSAAALKSFYQECILVFSTLISSGAAQLRKSKIPFNVAIIDEIGQAPEPETVIPMVAISKVSNHCHVVAVGDHMQLPPVALASFPMRKMKKRLHFDYDKQMVSIFERLYENGRASCQMLTRQYRMCWAVAEMNNRIFYEGRLHSPLPESTFDAPYNMGWNPKTKCFAKQTFIDTSLLPDRREFQEKNEGDYRNMEEVNVIDEVLQAIKTLAGPSFGSLRNQIAVLVPYRSQVEHVRMVLERFGKYVPHGVSREGFAILVDSVDSMQGSEKDIVIFGSTRSNLEQRIGFLDEPNCLNVATSRAKKLQIIIGDLSTIGRSKYFAAMKRFCLEGGTDSALLRIHPSNSDSLLHGLTRVEF